MICFKILIDSVRMQVDRDSDSLRAGRSGDRIPLGGALQTDSWNHSASCKMGTGLPGHSWGGEAAGAWRCPPTAL